MTVLYDEACGVCTALAGWLARHGDGLVVAAIGSELGELLLRDLTPAERYASVHAIDGAGRRRSGGAAVPVALDAVPFARPAAWLARRLPRATELAYCAFARHRGVVSQLFRISRARRRAMDPPQSRAPARGAPPAS